MGRDGRTEGGHTHGLREMGLIGWSGLRLLKGDSVG